MKTITAFMLVLSQMAISHAAWECNEVLGVNHATQIDAGLGLVVATDRSHHSHLLSGSNWYNLPGNNLRHVSVGHAGIWGVDTKSKVHRLQGGTWTNVPGHLRQVDAGGNAFAVGVGNTYNSYCLSNSYTWGLNHLAQYPWTSYHRGLIYHSCGYFGCWAIDSLYRVYFTRQLSQFSCVNPQWTLVNGLPFKMIEVGSDGSVFGVTPTGQVYQRTGINASVPQGLSWVRVPMCVSIRHVSYDLGQLWAVSHSGLILRCINSPIVNPPVVDPQGVVDTLMVVNPPTSTPTEV
ncbi:fish-egg lectin-like [Myripristis murdjan]|uniref:Fish-egg lectin-like n=1 Tax=Myripristis murdjan TaxID=586833 RepID=A0A668ACL6_9TELE|nr:fish-egg lectin-like [Myripristis murdjan]